MRNTCRAPTTIYQSKVPVRGTGYTACQPTKIGYLESQAGTAARLGHYLELSYSLIDAIGLTFTYRRLSKWRVSRLILAQLNMVNMEMGGLKWLQLLAPITSGTSKIFAKPFPFREITILAEVGGRGW